MRRSGLSGCIRSRKEGIGDVIRVPSETSYIRKVSSKILEGVACHNPNESAIFDIRLCVEEALRNAIVHGNLSKKGLEVKVSYRVEGDRLYIEIEDEGNGFDTRRVADPTSAENVTRNCGRGVYLIRHLMDTVEYNDRGNRISMMKRIKQ